MARTRNPHGFKLTGSLCKTPHCPNLSFEAHGMCFYCEDPAAFIEAQEGFCEHTNTFTGKQGDTICHNCGRILAHAVVQQAA